MAELAGSIVGMVSAGTQVALVLSQLAADVGSAGHEARMIGGEIRSFCLVLKTLGETMAKIQTSPYFAHCSEMIEDMTEASLEMFTEILNAVESIQGLTAGKDGKDGAFSFGRRVQWVVFQKPKIVMLRAAIEAYKSNLSLMLSTLSAAEKASRRIPLPEYPEVIAEDEQERSFLKSLELDRKASLLDLEQAERHYEESIAEVSLDKVTSDNPTLPGTEVVHDSLLSKARDGVESIRSGVSKSSNFDSARIQHQVTLHSQRLSQLLEEPQKRLSQRWSTILPPLDDNDIFADIPKVPLARPSSPVINKKHSVLTSSSDPSNNENYKLFRWWFLQQPSEDQSRILETLKSDLAGHSKELSNYKIKSSPQDRKKSAKVLGIETTQKTKQLHSPAQEVLRLVNEQLANHHAQFSKDPNSRALENQPTGFNVDLRQKDLDRLPLRVVDVICRNFTERLSLSWNRLATIPHDLSLCTHLQYLDLRHNRFETIPEAVLSLASLEALDMRQNQLKVIPNAISNMRSLKVLSLANNNIQGIPFIIANMRSLQVLNCVGNPIIFPPPNEVDIIKPFVPSKDGNQAAFHFNRMVQLRTYLRNFNKEKLTSLDERAITGEVPLNSLNIQLGTASLSEEWMRRPSQVSDSLMHFQSPKGFQRSGSVPIEGTLASKSEKDSSTWNRSDSFVNLSESHVSESELPRLSTPRTDSPTLSPTATKFTQGENGNSRVQEETSHTRLNARAASASPLQRRFPMYDTTRRYSTMISPGLSTPTEEPADDPIQKYMGSFQALSPPPYEKTHEPLQPPIFGALYRRRG